MIKEDQVDQEAEELVGSDQEADLVEDPVDSVQEEELVGSVQEEELAGSVQKADFVEDPVDSEQQVDLAVEPGDLVQAMDLVMGFKNKRDQEDEASF